MHLTSSPLVHCLVVFSSPVARKANGILAGSKKFCGQQDQDRDHPTVLYTSEVTPQILCSVLAPHWKKVLEMLECVQRWATEVVKGLEYR